MENPLAIFGSIAAGLVLGGAAMFFYLRARFATREAELRGGFEAERATLLEQLKALPELKEEARTAVILQARVAELEARLDSERKSAAEKLQILEDARTRLANEFASLSVQALKSNSESFMTLAKTTFEKLQEGAQGQLEKKEQAIAEMVKPVRDSLEKVDGKIQQLEKARAGAYEGLLTQMQSIQETQKELRGETGNLVKALRSPVTRGRWGELQLKRVVEMAGMLEHCDFEQQTSLQNEDGRLRPDLVVRLPGGRSILVDAKTPLAAYLDAMECSDDAQRKLKLSDHTRQIRAHIASLGRKAYWEQISPAPEFVVLFLPGESFFSAALQDDPGLIEAGMKEKVILATPTTLIALLRSVAFGWRQEKLAENAQEISQLGRELYKRLSDMAEHWSKLGRSIAGTVESYNRAVGSLESRVLITARKFKELQAAPENTEVVELPQVEQAPRLLQAPEFSGELFDK